MSEIASQQQLDEALREAYGAIEREAAEFVAGMTPVVQAIADELSPVVTRMRKAFEIPGPGSAA